MECRVEINGLRLFARHGVMEQERVVGNLFEVSASLVYPFGQAMSDDDIAGTLNYAEAVEVIKEQMDIPSKTLENVLFRLKTALSDRFPLISSGTLTIAKITPPISAELRDVAVKISW